MSLCPTGLLCAFHACMRPYCKRSATLLSMHTFLQCPASSGQPSCPLPLVHDHSALPHAFNASCATQTVASAPPPPLPPRCGVASFQHAFFGRTARTHDRQACPWQYLCGFHVICQSTCCARSSEQGDGRCSGGGSGGGDAPAGQVRRRARPLPTSPGHELHSLPSYSWLGMSRRVASKARRQMSPPASGVGMLSSSRSCQCLLQRPLLTTPVQPQTSAAGGCRGVHGGLYVCKRGAVWWAPAWVAASR